MKIKSRILAPVNGLQLPVLDATVGDKRIVIAVIVGDYAAGTVESPGNDCIQLLTSFMGDAGMTGTIHRVEIATAGTIDARVHMVLAAARHGDGVVFICATVGLFDTLIPTLNVRR
jgi:hypothetical protein